MRKLYFRTTVTVISVFVLFGSPFFVFAAHTVAHIDERIAEIQAEIRTLSLQIQDIQGQLNPGSVVSSAPGAVSPSMPTQDKFSTGDRVQVSSGPLNVRSSGSRTASVLGREFVGALGTVTPLGCRQGWCYVEFEDGISGWSKDDYLSLYTSAATAPPPPPPVSGNASFTFSRDGDTLVVGRDTWTFTLENAKAGDTLTVDAFKNGILVEGSRLQVCTVQVSETSCSRSSTPTANDVGSWSENVLINGVNKGIISFTVVSPETATAPASPDLPPVSSTKFSMGDRVQVSANTLNVRSAPAGIVRGTQANGVLGTVVDGPTANGGTNWWNINYDTGSDGWSSEDFLTKYSASSVNPSVAPTTPNTSVSGSPVFYKDSSPVSSITCGDMYTFQVNDYTSPKVWLLQYKNNIPTPIGEYDVPTTYTSRCTQGSTLGDEGFYTVYVYTLSSGQQGSYLGATSLTINPRVSTTLSPPALTTPLPPDPVSPSGSATGVPVFYKDLSTTVPVNSVTCGDTYTLRVNGYAPSQVWLLQYKAGNPVPQTDRVYNVPSTYISRCTAGTALGDEGTYTAYVYIVSDDGARGTFLGVTSPLTVNARTTTTTPPPTGTPSVPPPPSGALTCNAPADNTAPFQTRATTGNSALGYNYNWNIPANCSITSREINDGSSGSGHWTEYSCGMQGNYTFTVIEAATNRSAQCTFVACPAGGCEAEEIPDPSAPTSPLSVATNAVFDEESQTYDAPSWYGSLSGQMPLNGVDLKFAKGTNGNNVSFYALYVDFDCGNGSPVVSVPTSEFKGGWVVSANQCNYSTAGTYTATAVARRNYDGGLCNNFSGCMMGTGSATITVRGSSSSIGGKGLASIFESIRSQLDDVARRLELLKRSR